ncbi:MAG TPA: lamin tail domain-containing protein, partial [Phycisphaerae bacterium]|nr:lamin tail domain-containing protein [Phycisphaerae bacterium]
MNRDGIRLGHRQPLFEPLEPRLLLDGSVIISEFMADNDLAWEDPEQSDVYPDWIEIHNTEPTTVNLNGWSLEDDSHRWYFPDVDLAAGGYLVVMADGADQRDPAFLLRTDFSLKSGGEYLALRRADDSYAWEYTPEYPKQFENISYGIGQDIEVATLVGPHADAAVYVPTSDPGWGLAWAAYDYDDSAWTLRGQTGVGYEAAVPGFAVYNYFAKSDIGSLGEAESVIATPSKQLSIVSRNDPVINYWRGGHFGGDVPYPGTSFSEDPNRIVTEAFATITISTAGDYTFGVASDEGFGLQIVGATTTWVGNSTTPAGSDRIDFAGLRGTGDTLGTFNFPTAGQYDLRLVVFENGGGQSGELFAAPGSHTTYDSSFDLVGDTANGGLYVESQVVSGSAAGGVFEDVIGTDVEAAMRGVNTSAYVRIPFDVADRTAYDSLTLKILYDDGFVAYLNGVKVAERNAPASLAWNSAATADRAKADALVYAEIDVSAYLDDLRDGTNVLAIHGLNYQVPDLEFLVLAQLVDIDILVLGEHYFSTSSPGEPNTTDYYAYVKDTAFDHDRGFYDAAFDLVISTATPDATIRYTLNGSWPTATSGYVFDPATPIHIVTTTVVRAAAYREGFEPTNVD